MFPRGKARKDRKERDEMFLIFKLVQERLKGNEAIGLRSGGW
jgi:hypothetical protein